MKRSVRVLLPWFERQEAITALRGFRVPEPGANVSIEALTYEGQRCALLARPAFVPPPSVVSPLPSELEDHASALLRNLEQTGRTQIRPVLVNLRGLLSIQKGIGIDEAIDRVQQRMKTGRKDDSKQEARSSLPWKALAELCLPLDAVQEDLQGTFDKDGKGITISSSNPNLRAGSVQNIRVGENGRVQVIGFNVNFGSPHVYVTEYKGRFFLKDGYHRCYGLLSAGVDVVPAIYDRAESFADVHSGSPSLISQESLLGEHPPMLVDFLDPAVSFTTSQQACRKAVRIRAEEFVINV